MSHAAPAAPSAVAGNSRLGPAPTAGVVVGIVAVSAVLATVVKHGPVPPWSVFLGLLLLAALYGLRILWTPANPALRHVSLAVVAGGMLLLACDHISQFGNTEIATVAAYVPVVAGLTVLTGLNGQLSLGHGALMAVGAYTAAELMLHQPHVALLVLFVAALVVTAGGGVAVGAAAARLRGPYLAGATLAFALALPEIFNYYPHTFGADQGEPVRSPGVPGWLNVNFGEARWLAWLSIVVVLVVLVLLANLATSGIGRKFRCVRDDETAAALAGIDIARTQVLAFVVSAGCAGVSGALFAFVKLGARPGIFDVTLGISLLVAIVIGGVGSLAGAVWGSIALVFIPTYATSLSSHLKLKPAIANNIPHAVYGVILILAMLLSPEGIQGGLRRSARILRR